MKIKLKKINIHITLIGLLFFLSFIGVPGGNTQLLFLPENFERTPLELIQIFFIISNIFMIFRNRKLIFYFSNKISYYLKLYTMLFILYEESSYITKGLSPFFNKFNIKYEINFHNLEILNNLVLKKIFIPGTEMYFNLTYSGLIFLLFLLIIGFGSYLEFGKNFNFFFIEPKFSFYSLFLLIELILTFLIKNLIKIDFDLLSWEQIELFLYILLWVDTIYKLKNYKNLRTINK